MKKLRLNKNQSFSKNKYSLFFNFLVSYSSLLVNSSQNLSINSYTK